MYLPYLNTFINDHKCYIFYIIYTLIRIRIKMVSPSIYYFSTIALQAIQIGFSTARLKFK